MINPNQRIQGAFGDIFTPNTAATDRTAQILYAEEKQREAQRQRKGDILDAEMTRSAYKLRPADIDEYYNKYNTYKKAWMDLQRSNPKGRDFLEKQTKLNQLKADMYAYGSMSLKEKQNEMLSAADMRKNADAYEDDALDFLAQRMNTPVSKFKFQMPNPKTGQLFDVDMTDIYGNTKFKGSKTNFLPVIAKAIGKNNDTLSTFDTPAGEYEVQRNKIIGTAKTAPEIANSLLQQIVGSRMSSDLGKAFSDLTDADIQRINSQYDELVNTDLYKKSYSGKKIDFPEYMYGTRNGQIAMLLAKQAAIENAPKQVQDGKPYVPFGVKREVGMADWKTKHAITQRDVMKRIEANKSSGAPASEGLKNPMDIVNANYGTYTEDGERFIPANKIGNYIMSTINPLDANKGIIPVTPKKKKINGVDVDGFTVNKNGDWEGADGKVITYYGSAVETAKDVPTKVRKETVNDLNTLKNTKITGKKVYNPKTGKFE